MSIETDAIMMLVENLTQAQRDGKAEIMEGIKGIQARLDALNGRTRKNSEAIVDLQASRDESTRRMDDFKRALEDHQQDHRTERKASDDGDDDSTVAFSGRMSKTMYITLASGIAALGSLLLQYLAKMLHLNP